MHVLIVGLGLSGQAAAGLVSRLGGSAVVVDDQVPPAQVLARLPGSAELLPIREAIRLLPEVDMVVPSPGVPRWHEILAAAVARGIPVRSELVLGASCVDVPLLAVTGTNGKSTTVRLLGDMLEAAGRRVFVGGNIGNPLSNAAGESFDVCVVEVSSFQLEWASGFSPTVAAVLNLSADHLDRHGTMERYIATKLGMLAGLGDDARIVLGRDQGWWGGLIDQGQRGRLSTFGRSALAPGMQGMQVDLKDRVLHSSAGWTVTLARDWPLAPHDFENAAAAAEIARLSGAAPGAVETALAAYSGLDHRLRCVGQCRGITFWNDSKATNVGATLRSLEAFDEPVILMAGGVSKGADFTPLAQAASKLRHVVAYGEAAARLCDTLAGLLSISRVACFDDAFAWAVARAGRGGIVLLAPACASFDEFVDYAERGRRFEELVGRLEQ